MQNGQASRPGDTLPPSNIPNSYASSGKDRNTRSHESLRSSPENHCVFGHFSTRRVSPRRDRLLQIREFGVCRAERPWTSSLSS